MRLNKNNSNKTIIEQRRLMVASMRIKGLTQREIVDELTRNGSINEKKNKSWSLGIINRDITEVENLWRDQSIKEITEHKARQLAELAEVKKQGWRNNDMNIVLKVIEQESNILGTKAALKQEVTGNKGSSLGVESRVIVYIPENGRDSVD